MNAHPDQRLRGQLLLLRGRSNLTQRALAALLGLSEAAIQNWEAGRGYPSPVRLQALITLCVQRGVFAAGQEEAEARALWAALQRESSQRTPPFDADWFATLQPQTDVALAGVGVHTGTSAEPVAVITLDAVQPAAPRRAGEPDWGEAPEVSALQGREAELQMLRRWVLDEHCRAVALLGLGGIGKTALATRLAQDLAPHYQGLCWRSLRNAPPPEEWLGMAIAAVAPVPPVLPPGLPARLGLLLALLREHRCLLVLDNLETVLEPGTAAGRYRAGYEGYGVVLRRLSESPHQGCLLLTTREAPPEMALLAGETAPVRTLRLDGLDLLAARTLLADKGLAGDDAAWQALVVRYGGNPLALQVVGQGVAELFGGDIAAFLDYVTESYGAVFGGLRVLLDSQMERLSPLARSVLYWLAVEREPVGVARLAADLGPGAGRGALLETVAGLGQRSLLERGAQGGTHTLQPVVLEYATERLVEEVGREIVAGEPRLLVSHALVQAQTRDYVRRSQEQLIALPLLEHLRTSNLGSAAAVEQRLRGLLAGWRGRPAGKQGYGPGNVVNLLRLLRGDLRGLDLSQLAIRQAYLQDVEAQDASLAGAHLAEAALAEAFNHPFSLALSADGAYLAAGTKSGEVCRWRVADGALLLVMQGHVGGVWRVALSGDGEMLASGGIDGTVKLWRWANGQLLTTLRGHTGRVMGVALSGNGHVVASASQDGTVRIWETGGGQLLATLPVDPGGVWSVVLSHDGRLLISGSFDGSVTLWDADRRQVRTTLQGHTGGVWGLALSRDETVLATGSYDGTIKLWDLPAGRLLATLQGHTSAVRGVALRADGRVLASSSLDGTVKVWDVPEGRLLATLQGHMGGVLDVALSADGQVLVSGGEDGTVKLWELPGGRQLATVQGANSGVQGVALSSDGQRVASASEGGTFRLWEVTPAEGYPARLLTQVRGHAGAAWAVALRADGQVAATSGYDGTIRLWEAASGRLLATLHAHAGAVRDVALSADGRLLASGGEDSTVRLWRVSDGHLLATLRGHGGLIHGVALSGDGQVVASAGEDGTVRLWQARPQDHERGRTEGDSAGAWEPLATLRGHRGAVWAVALSQDGGVVASGGIDGTLRLWAARSGQLLETVQGPASGVYAVALSRDGRCVASGGVDGTVGLWEVPGGCALNSVQAHAGTVRSLALAADGLLASGGEDGTVRLWAASSGACLRTLRAERRYERMDITGLSGVTEAQRAALLALGAVRRP